MQPIQTPMTRPVLGPMLVHAPLDLELPPLKAVPVVEIPPPVKEVENQLDRELISLLRANLHAASQHVALGHEGRSFRECSRASCQDAARLIPQLDEVEPSATDAELEAILDRVLAALQQSLPQAPAVRTGFVRGGTSWSAPMAK